MGISDTTVIQFSGGRTSAYMLRRLLDEYQGYLPKNWKICFENTGKEREETLAFIKEVSERWKVNITWLEFDDWFDATEYIKDDGSLRSRKQRSGVRFKIVDYASASRKGEPFLKMLEMSKGLRTLKGELPLLPNPVQRICTDRLKVKVLHSYLRSLGWEEWDCFVGIRADEAGRLSKMRMWSPRYETLIAPLITYGVTKSDVKDYWTKSPFDLQLDPNSDEGNCDLCFLKATGKLIRIMQKDRTREEWWKMVEDLTGTTFSRTKPSFHKLAEMIDRNDPALNKWLKNTSDKTVDCFCGD